MSDRNLLAQKVKELLHMDLEPVGVTVFTHKASIPESVAVLRNDTALKSYCQGLTMAARGKSFFGGAKELGCVLGTSVLGLESDPDSLLGDTVREKFGAGLFENEEASRKSVLGAPRYDAASNQGVLIGPLGTLPAEPELVIFEVDPEQAMWLLYAVNFDQGGVQSLPQSGGVAGGCADVTYFPLKQNEANLTFLGLGCRLKSAIPPTHLLLGLPFARFEALTANLERMAKPISVLAKANQTSS